MVYPLVLRVAMPDRRGRSYREWSSDESECDDSESDQANEPLPQPSRARTLAVEPSPFTVALSQEVVPFAIDVSSPVAVDRPLASRRDFQLFSCIQEELVHEGFRAVSLDDIIDDAPAMAERFDQSLEDCQVGFHFPLPTSGTPHLWHSPPLALPTSGTVSDVSH